MILSVLSYHATIRFDAGEVGSFGVLYKLLALSLDTLPLRPRSAQGDPITAAPPL